MSLLDTSGLSLQNQNSPPHDIIDQFLTQYKRSSGMQRIYTDLGKKLAHSKLVCATVK